MASAAITAWFRASFCSSDAPAIRPAASRNAIDAALPPDSKKLVLNEVWMPLGSCSDDDTSAVTKSSRPSRKLTIPRPSTTKVRIFGRFASPAPDDFVECPDVPGADPLGADVPGTGGPNGLDTDGWWNGWF